MVNNQVDFALGQQVCKLEGIYQILEQVKLRWRADFANARRGDNTDAGTLGSVTESVIGLPTDNLASVSRGVEDCDEIFNLCMEHCWRSSPTIYLVGMDQ